MAEPSEGTYIILSAGSSKAIDVKGASDKSGTNVQQYTKNNGDGQIWSLAKPEDATWQIICSLTGQSLDVEAGKVTAGTNVRQWSDNNSNAQRWTIETDGGTFTYNNKSYNTYTIKPTANTSLALDVISGSSANGANIRLWNANGSDAQKWIFIPVSAFKQEGTYEIVLASDTTMCLDVAGGSTANSSNIQVYSRNDSNAQKFRTDVNDETFLVRLFNANSGKVVDIKNAGTTAGTNVQQYTANNSASQNWLPVQAGTVKIDNQTVPVYELRAQIGNNLVMDCKGGGKKAKTNIQVYTKNNSIAQKFAFVKTEIDGSNLSMPTEVSPTLFTREGPGNVTVTGLTFVSKNTAFKARYKVRRYKAKRTSYSDSSWKNLRDDSTARSGWGDAWTSTFEATPVEGLISLPFSTTVTLNSTYRSAEVFIEVRAYQDDYGTGYKAHGPVRSSTVKVMMKPIVSVSSISFTTGDTLGVKTIMTDSVGSGCSLLRARLLGSDGIPISEWMTSTDGIVTHYADGSLYRLPTSGENVGVEYNYVDLEGAASYGIAHKVFSYASGNTITNSVSYLGHDSCVALVQGTSHSIDHCLIKIPDTQGSHLVSCDLYSTSNGNKQWVVLPPLNKDAEVIIMGSNNSGSTWDYAEVTCRVDSHLFIWNWTDVSGLDYSSIIVNNDAPPAQTRTYQTGIKFSNPASRIYPIGFSDMSLATELSVEGVVIDDSAEAVWAGPIPEHASLSDISKLIRLSGYGIHPVYRTPYGDWNCVGIESVDISKTAIGYSKASIKQRAVEE